MSTFEAEVSLLACLELEQVDRHRFRAQNFADGLGGVVFGGQILAQTVMASSSIAPTMTIKSMHTLFARGADPESPLLIDVEPTHVGRSFASGTVTFWQGDRLCNRSLVLLGSPEPDLIRHQEPAPSVVPPSEAAKAPEARDWWDLRLVSGADVLAPEAVGPPDLIAWTRFPGATGAGPLGQALLAYPTDGLLIATAMRPHPGVGIAMAHDTISTTVLSHTLSFHEPVEAADWHLLVQHSPYAGRGRTHGRGDVFTPDGRLVATYSQDNMVRAIPNRGPGR